MLISIFGSRSRPVALTLCAALAVLVGVSDSAYHAHAEREITWRPSVEYAAALMFVFQGGIDKNFVDDANPVRVSSHLWWSDKTEETYAFLKPTVGETSKKAPELFGYGMWLQYMLLLNPAQPTINSKLQATTWAYNNITERNKGVGPSWLQFYKMGSALSAWYVQTGYGGFLHDSKNSYKDAYHVLTGEISDKRLAGFIANHCLSNKQVPIVFSLVMPGGYSFSLEDENHDPLIILGAYEGVEASQWYPSKKIIEMAIHEGAHISLRKAEFQTMVIPEEFIVENRIRSAGYNITDLQGLLEEGAVRVIEGLFVKEVFENESPTAWGDFTNSQFQDGFLFVPAAVDRIWEKNRHWELPDVIKGVDDVLSSHLISREPSESKPVSAEQLNVLTFLDHVRSIGRLNVQVSRSEYGPLVDSYVNNLSAISSTWRGSPLAGVVVHVSEGNNLAGAEADSTTAWLLLFNISDYDILPFDYALWRDLGLNSAFRIQDVSVTRENWWLAIAAPCPSLEHALLIVNPDNLSTLEALTPWERWSFGVSPDLPIASGGGI